MSKEFIEDDEIKGKWQDFKSFLRLMPYIRPNIWGMLTGISFLLMQMFVVMIAARFLGTLIEDGIKARDYTVAVQVALTILGLEVSGILLLWLGRRFLSRASTKSIFNIRKELFRHLQLLPLKYFDKQPQGRIVTRMTHDVEGIEAFLNDCLGRLLGSIFMFSGAVAFMFLTHTKLATVGVLAIVPAMIFTWYSRYKIKEVNRAMSKLNSACNSKLSEYLNGLPVIRSLGLESYASERYRSTVEEHRDSLLAANDFYSWSRPLTDFLASLPLIGVTIWGGYLVFGDFLSLGLFVAFVRYCERFSYPLMGLTREIHIIQQAFTSAERLTTFLSESEEDSVLGMNGMLALDSLKGRIAFENVYMRYDGSENWVLKNVSFDITAGEKIGLVGRTGSGKTTTMSLLARLYDYQKGLITLDGIDLRKFDRTALRESIGVVSQDVTIFKGSLFENLACEAPLTYDEVLNAAKETGLDKVLIKANLTLDSEILEFGANLSTGEKQLISLTRILLKSPKILILDEATANIDPYYEGLIHQAVHKLMDGRTCLMIAHRLTTLKDCDRILVFEQGELVEVGNHKDLLKNKEGHFYKLQHNAKVL